MAVRFGNVANAGLSVQDTFPFNTNLFRKYSMIVFFRIESSTGVSQVIFSYEGALNSVSTQILYDTVSNTIGWADSSGVQITTITPTLKQWYCCALSHVLDVINNLTYTNFYIKPVGAPTFQSFSLSSTTGSVIGMLRLSVGNQKVFAGSSTSIFPLVGSICGLRIWRDNLLTQEDFDRESEQIFPFDTNGLYTNFRLESDQDLNNYTERFVTLIALSPSNVSSSDDPLIPLYNDGSH